MKNNLFIKITALFLSSLLITQNGVALASSGIFKSKITEDYVAIVNTNTVDTQSTGSIVFDDKNISKTSVKRQNNNIKSTFKHEEHSVKDTLPQVSNTVTPKVTPTKTYAIGETKVMSGITFTVIGIGKHSYIWMRNELKTKYDADNKTNLVAEDMIDIYDDEPYRFINSIANGNIPYEDNSGKMSILLEEIDGNKSGFYSSSDVGITTIHIATPEPRRYFTGFFELRSKDTLVHEVQHALFHMITANNDMGDTNDLLWFNEGLATVIGSHMQGILNDSFLKTINNSNGLRNGASLIYLSYRQSIDLDYGLPYLFVRYLINQTYGEYKPEEFMKSFYTTKINHRPQEKFLDEVIGKLNIKGITTFKEAIAGFYAAAFAQEPTGIYGFYQDPIVYASVTDYPVYYGISGTAVNLPPASSIVVKVGNNGFTAPSDAGTDIKFIGVNKSSPTHNSPKVGDGTEQNPYVIKTSKDLFSIVSSRNSHFKLGNDINMGNKNWVSITKFNGTIDGNGHTIKDINSPLFHSIGKDGNIKNLNVISKIHNEFLGNVGVISGELGGSIRNVHVTGSIDIKQSNSSSTPSYLGGLVGKAMYGSHIINSGSNVNITTKLPKTISFTGGISGRQEGIVENTYSGGSITATTRTTNNSSHTPIINIGGMFGQLYANMRGMNLNNLYTTTKITDTGAIGTKKVGQVVGIETLSNKNPNVDNLYYIDNTLNASGSSNNSHIATTAIRTTDTDLKQQSTFKGFDFNVIWKMGTNGYPVHKTASEIPSITANLSKQDYVIGEGIDILGGTLNIGSTTIELKEYMFNLDSWDTSTAGPKVLNGNYNGKDFTINYSVVAPTTVTNLIVDTNNKGKTNYIDGETYSMDNVVLSATINGKPSMKIYSGFTNDKNATPLTTTDTKVTLTYQNTTVDLPIVVNSKVVSQIETIKPLQKSTFNVGETLSLSGALFRIIYNDGSATNIFNDTEFSQHNIKIAQYINNAYVEIKQNKPLSRDDHNTKIYIYHGNILPSNPNSVFTEAGTIKVISTLSLNTQDLYFLPNEYSGAESEEIQGGSGSYTATLKVGIIPAWCNLYRKPENGNGIKRLMFDTKTNQPPTQEGVTELIFEIKDDTSQDSILAKINLHVVNKNSKSDVETFKLTSTASNKEYNGIIMGTNINVAIPNSEAIDGFQSSAILSRGATSSPGINTLHEDYTNPKSYTITSQDKSTAKTYTLTVTKTADIVTSITVSPNTTNGYQGTLLSFKSKVEGTGTFDTGVSWSVEDNTSPNTTINTNGDLYISHDELASRLTIIASSNTTPGTKGYATVSVLPLPQLSSPTNLKWTNNVATWNAVLNANSYTISLHKGSSNNIVQGSQQTVTTNDFDFTNELTMSGTGTYTFKVSANGDTQNYRPSISEMSTQFNFVLPSSISGVEVSPRSVNLTKGSTQSFTATVIGNNVTAQSVDWSLRNNNSQNTNIDANGLLTVGTNETSKNITVIATSAVDNTISGQAIVTIVLNKLTVPTNITFIGTTGNWDSVPNAKGYSLQLKKDNIVVGKEIMILNQSTTTHDFKSLMTLNGIYTFDINALGDNTSNSDSDSATSQSVNHIAPSTVTSVDITNNVTSVEKGKTHQFSAIVTGTNSPSRDVNWSINGHKDVGTSIDVQTGILTVSNKEMSTTLILTATSVQDATVFANLTINLIAPKLNPPTGLNFYKTTARWDSVVGNDGYTINLYKDNKIIANTLVTSKDVTTIELSKQMTTNGTYKFTVKANGNSTMSSDSDFVTSNNNKYIAPSKVTSITINPNSTTVEKGQTKEFKSVVNGINSPSQKVIWNIELNNNSNTNITQNGILSIDFKETAKIINVIATSQQDKKIRATVPVNINLAKLSHPLNLKFNGTMAKWDKVTNAKEYVVTLYQNNNPVENSQQIQSTNNYNFVNQMTTPDNYTFRVFAKGDMITYGVSDTATSTINTYTPPSIVHSITINPNTASIERGQRQQFKATVNGLHNPSQSIEWSVLGSVDSSTTITDNGLLTIGLNETVNGIRIKAISAENKSIMATMNVDITLAKLIAPINLTFKGNIAAWDNVENAVNYTLTLYNNMETIFKGDFTENTVNLSNYMADNGIYYFDVVANGDNINYIDSSLSISGKSIIDNIQILSNATNSDYNNAVNNNDTTIQENTPTVEDDTPAVEEEVTAKNNNTDNVPANTNTATEDERNIPTMAIVIGGATAVVAVTGITVVATGSTASVFGGITSLLKKLLSLFIK